MMDKMSVNKACRYYLMRDTDFILNFFITMLFGLGFNFLLYKQVFISRGDTYVILMLYILMVGFSLIASNSMVINLTVKDKLNKRIEFILSSGINIKDLIKSYTLEMWRLSSISSFILFFLANVFYDFEADFEWIIGIYVSSIIMLYFELLFVNITSLYQKNFKFFKNIVFFGTALFIYLVGTFSEHILNRLNLYNINLIHVILAINLSLLLIFRSFSMIHLKRISNESVINKEGTWS